MSTGAAARPNPSTAPTAAGDVTQLTHIALPVRDFDGCLAFWERYTTMARLRERTNPQTGLRNVWLCDPDVVTEHGARFVVVLLEGGRRPGAPAGSEDRYGFLTSIAHLGISMSSREAVDRAAELARIDGTLVLGPVFRNEETGYIALVRDPDGNNVEFSHGQVLG